MLRGLQVGGAGAAYASNGSHAYTASGDVEVVAPEEYLRKHDLVVHGQGASDRVPEPLQTFESARFPPDILEEVLSSLQASATAHHASAAPILPLLHSPPAEARH